MGNDTAALGLGLGGGLGRPGTLGLVASRPCLDLGQVWSWIMLCRDITSQVKGSCSRSL